MLTLRPYQRECLDSIKINLQSGHHRQLISLPTGAGKTVIFAHLIKELGIKALVLAHTNELLEQAKDKISMVCQGLDVGIVNGFSKEFNKPVVVSSIQSARVDKNLEELKNQGFGVVIADEAHKFGADSPRIVLDELGFDTRTNRLLCGFTATAFRSDGKGLGEVFDVVAYERTIKEMIEDGYLCPPKGIKISTDIDLSKVKMGGGDFRAESLAQVMDTPEICRIVVDSYLKEGDDRQTICFGVTVQHAYNLSELFKQNGVAAGAIHGGMLKKEREDVLTRYRRGQIQILCNCQVLTEGFDAPETSCVIIARPTQSKGLYQQMAGRGIRLFPNKRDCLILDLCTKHHSLCSTATLLEDVEDTKQQEKEERSRQKEIRSELPPNLNQKLKSALVGFDPLGEAFTWILNENGVYVLKGNETRLGIVPAGENHYRVILASDKGNQTIADGLNFEYAFAAGEDFARANRSAFVISDRKAYWRELPASEKQIALIRSKGFRVGLDNLTRGQAADLISSGALRRSA